MNDYAHGALEALARALGLLEETGDLGRVRRQIDGARDDLLAGVSASREDSQSPTWARRRSHCIHRLNCDSYAGRLSSSSRLNQKALGSSRTRATATETETTL